MFVLRSTERPHMRYRGDYSALVLYRDGDVVRLDGVAYVCVGGGNARRTEPSGDDAVWNALGMEGDPAPAIHIAASGQAVNASSGVLEILCPVVKADSIILLTLTDFAGDIGTPYELVNFRVVDTSFQISVPSVMSYSVAWAIINP